MTDTDRQHLTRILGMLGSEYQGERDNAARLAEEFRRQHALTWEEMLSPGATEPEPAVAEPVAEWPPYEPIQWRKAVLFACFWAALLGVAFAFH